VCCCVCAFCVCYCCGDLCFVDVVCVVYLVVAGVCSCGCMCWSCEVVV